MEQRKRKFNFKQLKADLKSIAYIWNFISILISGGYAIASYDHTDYNVQFYLLIATNAIGLVGMQPIYRTLRIILWMILTFLTMNILGAAIVTTLYGFNMMILMDFSAGLAIFKTGCFFSFFGLCYLVTDYVILKEISPSYYEEVPEFTEVAINEC